MKNPYKEAEIIIELINADYMKTVTEEREFYMLPKLLNYIRTIKTHCEILEQVIYKNYREELVIPDFKKNKQL